jgi:hypothetical protein
MAAQPEMSRAIDRVFRVALLLTGSVESAEIAVSQGITALERHRVSGDNLLLETVKFATRRRAGPPEQIDQACSILPYELCRVLLIKLDLRHCFVLRVLLGLTRETCVHILHLSARAVDDASRRGMQVLPFVVLSCVERWSHSSQFGATNGNERDEHYFFRPIR